MSKRLQCDENIDDNTLTVHLRSGDIFCPGDGNTNYVQPPVAYYEAIFRMKTWSKIIFITDRSNNDCMNPVWAYYLDESNRLNSALRNSFVFFRPPSSLEHDLSILLCSPYIALGYSTLNYLLIHTSEYLKAAFVPPGDGIEYGDHPITVNVYQCLLPGFAMGHGGGDERGPNTPAQRQYMLSYTPAEGVICNEVAFTKQGPPMAIP
jgi:hypothetical protein